MEEQQNNPLIQENPPEAKSEQKLSEEKLSRKRIFYALVAVGVILIALIIWEIVDLFV